MKDKKPKKPSWLSSRSALEYWLGGTCIVFLALIVVLIVALVQKSAPLEPDWGNVADWAGVLVTSFGFVGAIITVNLQGRGVRIQEEQHATVEAEKETKRAKAEAQAVKQAQDELEKWALAVDFKVIAKHRPRISWQQMPTEDGKLDLICRAIVREGIYTRAELIVPSLPDGFQIKSDRLQSERLGANGVQSIEWRVSGEGWFGGDDTKAQEWLLQQGPAVDFTDPAGISWRKHASGRIEELAATDASGHS